MPKKTLKRKYNYRKKKNYSLKKHKVIQYGAAAVVVPIDALTSDTVEAIRTQFKNQCKLFEMYDDSLLNSIFDKVFDYNLELSKKTLNDKTVNAAGKTVLSLPTVPMVSTNPYLDVPTSTSTSTPETKVEKLKFHKENIDIYDAIQPEPNENFNKSKIINFNTHSELPYECAKSFITVPSNIVICFTVPIMNMGLKESSIFNNVPAEKLNGRKELFKNMFRFKQNMDNETLKFTYYKNHGNANFFKHSSWYYPGQAVPNVNFSYTNDDNENMVSGKWEISEIPFPFNPFLENPDFDINEEEDSKKQILETGQFSKNLDFYLDKYKKNDIRYIFLITGCRIIPYHHDSQTINTNFYEFMINNEILTTIINRNITAPLNTGGIVSDMHLRTEYLTFFKNFAFYGHKYKIILLDFFHNLTRNKLQRKIKLSRFHKIYLDIIEKIGVIQSTDDELNYAKYNSFKKVILFIIRLLYNKQQFIKSPEGQVQTYDYFTKISDYDRAINHLTENKGRDLNQYLMEPINSIFNFVLHPDVILSKINTLNTAKYLFYNMIENEVLLSNPYLVELLAGNPNSYVIDELFVTKEILDEIKKPDILKMKSSIKKIRVLDCFPTHDDLKLFTSLEEIHLVHI